MGWTFAQIDPLTMADVEAIYDYWLDFPPKHELTAMKLGYERPKTYEEKIAAGAMGPEDFLRRFKQTNGKLN